MKKKKFNFKLGKGNYYFHVRSGQQMIIIYRKTKEAATNAFQMYQGVGKSCEWLGRWDGKQFTETKVPV